MNRRNVPPLPTRLGVGPSCVALPVGPWKTVAEFLVQRFPAIGASVWAQRFAAGEVVDEHGEAVTPTRAHAPHLRVYYYRSLVDEIRLPCDEVVLFQDAHIVVADKPHFLPVTPSGKHLNETLLVRLKRRLGIDTLAPAHRIDRETAGLVLFTIDPATRGPYQRLFAEQRIEKTYECAAAWPNRALSFPLTYRSRLVDDPAHFMRVRETEGEPNAETFIEMIERIGSLGRFRLIPRSGRRHQLRAHCNALGMPILGDRIYPALLPEDTDDLDLPLQLLAQTLAFVDPITGESRRFSSGLRLHPLGGRLTDHQ